MEFPDPVIEIAIEPKTKAGQEKMGIALAKLAEEDPTFKTYTNEETGQTIIAGMGELHLEIIVDRLLREFKVEANVGKPQVSYKETITAPRMWTTSTPNSPADVVSTVMLRLKFIRESRVKALNSKTLSSEVRFRRNTFLRSKKESKKRCRPVRSQDIRLSM